MNPRILVLSTLLALPLGNSLAADAAVETKAMEVQGQDSQKRLVRPTRFAKLEQLLEAGRAEIDLLNEQLRSATTPEAQNEIHMKIVAAKRAHRERFLEERMALAEESGDLLQADEARLQLEHLRNENNGSKLRVERPAPSEGGSR